MLRSLLVDEVVVENIGEGWDGGGVKTLRRC
jgi:hypothetical protein